MWVSLSWLRLVLTVLSHWRLLLSLYLLVWMVLCSCSSYRESHKKHADAVYSSPASVVHASLPALPPSPEHQSLCKHGPHVGHRHQHCHRHPHHPQPLAGPYWPGYKEPLTKWGEPHKDSFESPSYAGCWRGQYYVRSDQPTYALVDKTSRNE